MRRMLLGLTLAACAGFGACDADELMDPAGEPDAVLVPTNGESEITVMTRNIYLGFDIDRLLAGTMPLDQALADLQATDFPTRAAALAAEIAATQPDLIGLQEVIDYRVQVPGDFLETFVPNAQEPMLPFLYVLQQTLAAYGLDYVVVANNPTTDVEVPMFTSATEYMDIRYTDHDVILARSDVEVGEVTTRLFTDMLSFDLGGLPGTRPLGFVAVEAVVDGAPLIFASTHLETQDHPEIQTAQTKDLIKWTQRQKLPIVLVGDFNSAANANAPAGKATGTYDMLLKNGSFADVWSMAHPDELGLTCCHATDLAAENVFDQRIDLILIDKVAARLASDVAVSIVGVNPIQATQPRWASDHAGVVATFRLSQR